MAMIDPQILNEMRRRAQGAKPAQGAGLAAAIGAGGAALGAGLAGAMGGGSVQPGIPLDGMGTGIGGTIGGGSVSPGIPGMAAGVGGIFGGPRMPGLFTPGDPLGAVKQPPPDGSAPDEGQPDNPELVQYLLKRYLAMQQGGMQPMGQPMAAMGR